MRGLVLDVIDVGCVFHDVVCGFFKVAENIVSRAVPSRTPAGLEAVLAHIHHAAHHLIDVGDEVSDMVKRSVRGATEWCLLLQRRKTICCSLQSEIRKPSTFV